MIKRKPVGAQFQSPQSNSRSRLASRSQGLSDVVEALAQTTAGSQVAGQLEQMSRGRLWRLQLSPAEVLHLKPEVIAPFLRACVCVCVCVCARASVVCDWTLGAATGLSWKSAMSVRRHTKVLADGER